MRIRYVALFETYYILLDIALLPTRNYFADFNFLIVLDTKVRLLNYLSLLNLR